MVADAQDLMNVIVPEVSAVLAAKTVSTNQNCASKKTEHVQMLRVA